jgi:D-lactate dehydrogenase
MRIAIFEAEPREIPAFEHLKPHHQVTATDARLERANAAAFADAEAISTFIYSRLDRNVLELLPTLKFIATRSTGFDHIDADVCAARGIIVCNVPSYGENTVAEHVFALLLTISHRMREAAERARSGRFSPEGLQGFDLQGKLLGVVGVGAIGRHVVRIARGFGMRVIACDVKPDPGLARELGFAYASLEDLLSQADVISLNVPATPQTERLIDAAALARMKPDAVLVNTARGGIVDAIALVEALRSGRLAAAGLDVLPDEPLIREEAELLSSGFAGGQDLRGLIADHVLLQMPNVVVTPHSAFYTREAVGRIIATTIENIEAYVAGQPINVVAGAPRAGRS